MYLRHEVIGYLLAGDYGIKDWLYILVIEVKEEHRYAGIGKKLLSIFLNKYKDKTIILDALDLTQKRYQFYQSLGVEFLVRYLNAFTFVKTPNLEHVLELYLNETSDFLKEKFYFNLDVTQLIEE